MSNTTLKAIEKDLQTREALARLVRETTEPLVEFLQAQIDRLRGQPILFEERPTACRRCGVRPHAWLVGTTQTAPGDARELVRFVCSCPAHSFVTGFGIVGTVGIWNTMHGDLPPSTTKQTPIK